MNSIDKKELHELFDEIRQGNNNFENLYNKYYRLVYKIAFSILKNKENSEDIAQNVFTKIYKLDKEKLPTKSEATWLYSVTKNECIMYLRNNKESFDIDNLYNICDENDEISKIIDNDKYDRIINKLNKQEQEIVSLKIISQMSFKDIAKIVNMPIGTVQWHYYKALNSLKILISNITMFIISFTLYLKNSNTFRSKKTSDTIQKENETTIVNEPIHKIANESILQESTLSNAVESKEDNKYKNYQNEIENVYQNQINQAIVPDLIVDKHVTFDMNNILFICSFIFLTISIAFSVICIKYQQNQKKKSSK